MKVRNILVGIVIVFIMVISLFSYAWFTRPRLIDFQPDAEARDVPVTTQIRLEFSQAMNTRSVISHIKIEPSQEGEYSWSGNILTFIPNHTWPSGKEVRVRLEDGARAAGKLSFPMQGEEWSFITREALLVYLWPSDGPADIYALNPATGEIHQYTHRMDVMEFTATSNGIKFYFAARNTEGGSDVYEIDLIEETNSSDNSYKPEKLLDCGSAQCRSPAASMDGKNLAYEYLIPDTKGVLGPAQIWLFDLQNLMRKPIGPATHETVQPSWSSTGWLAYYDRTSQAYDVVHPEMNVHIQLLNQTGQPGSWSPDGKIYLAPEMMYYPATGDTERGISHLLKYGVQDKTSGDISKEDQAEDVEGIYSPDGRVIAYSRKYLDMERWSFGRQIWIMNPDGSDAHPITDDNDFNHYDLAWSWDSQKLAYVRFNQAKLYEPPELWMMNVDGSNPIQLVIGGYSPQWIP